MPWKNTTAYIQTSLAQHNIVQLKAVHFLQHKIYFFNTNQFHLKMDWLLVVALYGDNKTHTHNRRTYNIPYNKTISRVSYNLPAPLSSITTCNYNEWIFRRQARDKFNPIEYWGATNWRFSIYANRPTPDRFNSNRRTFRENLISCVLHDQRRSCLYSLVRLRPLPISIISLQ